MLVCIQYWIVHSGSLGLLVGRIRGCGAALSTSYLTEQKQPKVFQLGQTNKTNILLENLNLMIHL